MKTVSKQKESSNPTFFSQQQVRQKRDGLKYLWHVPQEQHEHISAIMNWYHLSAPIAQTLATRGFTTKELIDTHLFSVHERDVPHPRFLKDAEKAIARMLEAIEKKEKILVFGDYDVDGITSSSMMMHCLLPLGAKINFFLPHRVKDGYGISRTVIERAARNNYALVITVDNGITAFDAADAAQEHGIDLIITDHHRQHDELPNAFAVVNPNRDDCEYPFKALAGVGVTFKLLSLLYERKGLSLPDKVYELLLLGTIADVVPLTGENRFWVRYGLAHINRDESHALSVLKQNGNITKPHISSLDVGFSIAPQINALGRLEDPRDGVQFLIGSNTKEVERIGVVLRDLNQARKDIERGIFQEIKKKVDSGEIDLEKEKIIVAASDAWPPGVIGLVASRVVGTYGRPTLLFHLTKKGVAKGSCRSIGAFNIFDALSKSSDLITQFGGHSFAAGLALPQNNLSQLKERLEALAHEQLTPDDLQQKISLDARVRLSDLNKKFLRDLSYLEPFGHENPQPLFWVSEVTLVDKPVLLKNAHVKCAVFSDGVIKQLIFFNWPELYDKLIAQRSEPFDVAAQVTENHWRGRVNIELIGVDVAGLQEQG